MTTITRNSLAVLFIISVDPGSARAPQHLRDPESELIADAVGLRASKTFSSSCGKRADGW